MLVCLLAIGSVDLAQHVELVDNDAAASDDAHRRRLSGDGGSGLDASVAVVHVSTQAPPTTI